MFLLRWYWGNILWLVSRTAHRTWKTHFFKPNQTQTKPNQTKTPKTSKTPTSNVLKEWFFPLYRLWSPLATWFAVQRLWTKGSREKKEQSQTEQFNELHLSWAETITRVLRWLFQDEILGFSLWQIKNFLPMLKK